MDKADGCQTEKSDALEQAKAAAVRKNGLKGNTALAKLLNDEGCKRITPQAISQWTEVPLGRVFDIERVTGIPREQLRPDFFEEERDDAA